ncbi:site-specific integrase [Leptolyngbya sp. FACHB-671]|uniref:tyrosine-type recombinase/integrase n=1 Tax=Leptolyngbya sp. FACHB-671 TaxID=2692812 RepID=UPI0016848D8E|nr:site-specific integrase [Leptolyngbya sp. FACHB-671]MBD2066247.1 site-specific integrase [Leptolyngbya sp. FACHB-671]
MPRDGKTNRSGSAAILEPDELQDLFGELGDPYRAISQICYLTAGRIGEVVNLRVEHLRNGYVVFPVPNTKTNETRKVIMSEPLQKVLKRIKPAAGYLFSSGSKTGHITTRAVEKHVKLAADLLGFEGVSLHSFRRSRLTHLHERGWGLHELKRVSGHKSLSQLQAYLGVDQAVVDEKLKQADVGFEVA